MRSLGATEADVALWRRPAAPCEILPEAVEAVRIFLSCATQWRTAGMGGLRVGLDYAGVRAALLMQRIRPSRSLFDDLRVMEAAAVRTFVEEARR